MQIGASRRLLESVSGLEVGRVLFGPFYVSIDLLGDHNLFLRLNKSFTIGRGGALESFKMESSLPQRAAASLVACVASKVVRLQCVGNQFELAFSNGNVLSVSLAAGDFEPLEVSCAHHVAPHELLWHTIIEAE